MEWLLVGRVDGKRKVMASGSKEALERMRKNVDTPAWLENSSGRDSSSSILLPTTKAS